MSARAWILVFVASCYAPHAVPGSACTPDVGCPAPETCELVGGHYTCVEGRPADAALDGPPRDAAIADTPRDTPQAPRWALVQTRASGSATTSVAATGAGHLIVVAVEASAVTDVTDSAGTTYVAVPGGRASNAAAGNGVELWYAASSNAGA